jgi:hypothetical protein
MDCIEKIMNFLFYIPLQDLIDGEGKQQQSLLTYRLVNRRINDLVMKLYRVVDFDRLIQSYPISFIQRLTTDNWEIVKQKYQFKGAVWWGGGDRDDCNHGMINALRDTWFRYFKDDCTDWIKWTELVERTNLIQKIFSDLFDDLYDPIFLNIWMVFYLSEEPYRRYFHRWWPYFTKGFCKENFQFMQKMLVVKYCLWSQHDIDVSDALLNPNLEKVENAWFKGFIDLYFIFDADRKMKMIFQIMGTNGE